MRVLNRADFLLLRPGTIYCKGTSWAFDGPCVKGDTIGNDWAYRGLNWIDAKDSGEATLHLEISLETGESFPMESCYGRDGCFDEDAVFLVYDKADCLMLLEIAAIGARTA